MADRKLKRLFYIRVISDIIKPEAPDDFSKQLQKRLLQGPQGFKLKTVVVWKIVVRGVIFQSIADDI